MSNYLPLRYATQTETLIPDEFKELFLSDDIIIWSFNQTFRKQYFQGKYTEFHRIMFEDYKIEDMPGSFIRSGMTQEQRITEWREYISMLRNAKKWNQNKIIYRVDSDFEKELIQTEGTKIPYSILDNIPFDCFYIEFDQNTIFYQYHGVYINIFRTKENWFFTLNRITHDEVTYHSCIATGENTFGFGIKEYEENGEKGFFFTGEGMDLSKSPIETLPFNSNLFEMNRFVLNFILYLCSDKNDVVLSDESMQTYRKPNIIKNKYSEIRKYDVGHKLGKLVREYKKRDKKTYPNGTSKRPHIRRPHWAKYHIGKGRTKTILRWISQIIVHEELLEE